MKLGRWAKIGFFVGLLGPAVIGVPFGVGLPEALGAGVWILALLPDPLAALWMGDAQGIAGRQ